MNKTIDIIVSPNGDISINAIGFKGADCEKATQALEESLGVVSNRVKKPEYHASTAAKHQQRLGAWNHAARRRRRKSCTAGA